MKNRHPKSHAQYTPRVVVEPDGVQQWYYGDLRGRNMGLNAVAGKPRDMCDIDASSYDEMRPGCFNVDERVRDMNAGGQLAGLKFPNWTGFSGQVLNQGPDRDVNVVMIKADNDWHVDEWCGSVCNRFAARPVGSESPTPKSPCAATGERARCSPPCCSWEPNRDDRRRI